MEFSHEVVDRLQFYVYRLVDPRDGVTFYVGKGNGNRIFSHAKAQVRSGEADNNLRLNIIREIIRSGLEVITIIHRHGMDERTAFEVEAALIDAYPGLSNRTSGHRNDFGVRHSIEIIRLYEAPILEVKHRLVAISLSKKHSDRTVYDQVRYAWKIDPKRANAAEYILALDRGLVVGVFVAKEWLPATTENFPGSIADRPRRHGFIGEEAEPTIKSLYIFHRVPQKYRKPGAANPVSYLSP